jgi:glutathione synthase/RimK-type ligase-like ATP-grasp enzyme
MARGYVERPEDQTDTLIYTNRVLEDELDNLNDLQACPTLFQEYIDKHCDVRITVVDSCLCAVELLATDRDGTQRCDIRRNNMEDVAYRCIDLPEDVKFKILKIVEHYKLRFATIDMVIDTAGRWYFLEINPNGQWAWLDITGGMDIASYFVKSFSESKRESDGSTLTMKG